MYNTDKWPDDGTCVLAELVVTVSGEVGAVPQGTKTLIVRFAGCNLACSYCDTPQTQIIGNPHQVMEVPCLAEKIDTICKSNGIDHVLFTGGEPLIYADAISNIIDFLSKTELYPFVTIETNGTYNIRQETKLMNTISRYARGRFAAVVDIKLDLYEGLPAEVAQYNSAIVNWALASSMYTIPNVIFKVVCFKYGHVRFGIHIIHQIMVKLATENIPQKWKIYFAPVMFAGDMEMTKKIVDDIKYHVIANNPFHLNSNEEVQVGINCQIHKLLEFA